MTDIFSHAKTRDAFGRECEPHGGGEECPCPPGCSCCTVAVMPLSAAFLAPPEPAAHPVDVAPPPVLPPAVPDSPEQVTTAAEQPPADAPPAPVPLFAGTYAIYDDGAGGVMLVLQQDGDVIRKHIPAKLIKMAEMATGGAGGLAGLFGRF